MLTFVIIVGRVNKKQRIAGSGSNTRDVNHSSVERTLKSVADLKVVVEQSLIRVGEHDSHHVGGRGRGLRCEALPSEIVPATCNPVVGGVREGDVERCWRDRARRVRGRSNSHGDKGEQEAEKKGKVAMHGRD